MSVVLLCEPGTGDRAVGRELGVNDIEMQLGHCEGTCCTRDFVAGFGLFSPSHRAPGMFVCEPRGLPFLKWKNQGPH